MALPGRGRHAPRPPGLRPLVCPSAHGHPAASVSQQEGLRGTGATVAGVGKPQACPCPTPSPFSPSPWSQFFKGGATGGWASCRLVHAEGVSPCSGGGGQTPAPPIGRLSTLGGQRGCPRPERTTGRSLERYLRVTVFCDLAENEYWRGFPADFGLFSWDHF